MVVSSRWLWPGDSCPECAQACSPAVWAVSPQDGPESSQPDLQAAELTEQAACGLCVSVAADKRGPGRAEGGVGWAAGLRSRARDSRVGAPSTLGTPRAALPFHRFSTGALLPGREFRFADPENTDGGEGGKRHGVEILIHAFAVPAWCPCGARVVASTGGRVRLPWPWSHQESVMGENNFQRFCRMDAHLPAKVCCDSGGLVLFLEASPHVRCSLPWCLLGLPGPLTWSLGAGHGGRTWRAGLRSSQACARSREGVLMSHCLHLPEAPRLHSIWTAAKFIAPDAHFRARRPPAPTPSQRLRVPAVTGQVRCWSREPRCLLGA